MQLAGEGAAQLALTGELVLELLLGGGEEYLEGVDRAGVLLGEDVGIYKLIAFLGHILKVVFLVAKGYLETAAVVADYRAFVLHLDGDILYALTGDDCSITAQTATGLYISLLNLGCGTERHQKREDYCKKQFMVLHNNRLYIIQTLKKLYKYYAKLGN